MSRGESSAVWLFALGLLLIYAGSYYAFPALLPMLEAETHWGKPALALGPTLGTLAMAVLTPLTGRLVDQGRGRRMLLVMPPVAALAMVGLAVAPNPMVWWGAWIVVGAAQAGAVYETVFSLLTRRLGAEARPAITRVTMVAGLSGTMTFPLGHWLGVTFGGQNAYFGFAALTLLGTLPLYLLAVRRLGPDTVPGPAVEAGENGSALKAALRRPAFWGIAAIFSAAWLNHGLLLTFILLLFHDRGVSATTATLAAACLGPAQLVGRLVLFRGGARLRNAAVTQGALALVVLAALLLIAAGAAPMLVFAVVAVQGGGMGLMSIMRPMLLVDELGRRGFGGISGVAAIGPLLASALAPTLGAQLLAGWGPAGIYAALLVLSVFAFGLAQAMLRRRTPEG